jgi:beta-lactamase regulating signal transducer with metallopeptidase domain
MNGLVVEWSFSSSVLLWFVTTLAQVTVLSSLVLLATRFLAPQAVVRHSLLTVALLLIVVAPWSTLCLQRAGLGVIAITEPISPNGSLSNSLTNSLADIENSSKFGESKTQGTNDTANTEAMLADANASFLNDRTRLEGETLVGSVGENLPSTEQTPALTTEFDNAVPAHSMAASLTALENSAVESKGIVNDLLTSPWSTRLLSAIAALWLFGCGAMAIRWLVAWTRLQRLIRQSKPANSLDVESAFLAACRVSRCDSQAVRLVTSQSIATPAVAGIRRPTIVIPETHLGSVSAQQLVLIFVHELAHIVRRDQLMLVLQQVARVLFWAHPLVGRVCQRLTQSSEEICDNYVLSQSSTKAYSQTLLVVAELATGRRNPLGTIGVVGGWSLTERIAGLLDKRRERATSLSGRSRAVVAMLSVCLSAVLLLTFRSDLVSAASPVTQLPLAQEKTLPSDPKDGIRGSGDQLEFRLRGRLLNGTEEPLVNPTVTVSESGSEQTYPATVVGDRYELWLPARSLRWLSPRLEAKSEDGRRGVVIIGNTGLRKAISQEVDIPIEYPTRAIKVLVMHNHQPVANAHIKLLNISSPIEVFAKSDAKGEAIIKLNGKPNVAVLTAWTDSGLIGGYQTQQKPSRDPNSAEYVIELFECQTRKIEVIDTDGSPVEGVRLKLQVATLKNYNYLGNPPGSDVVTDSTGTANYRWFPKLEGGVHHYAELKDGSDWKLLSQRNTENAVEIVVAKPAKRVRVDGQVSRGGLDVGGIVVQANSFQGEQKGRVDVLIAIADREGKFSFDALPNSTYSLFVIDDQLVSAPKVFTPVDPKSDERKSPYLMALDGQPVTIQLSSGPDRNPIAGQSVSLVSEFPYSWWQDGEKRNGMTHRQIFATTDDQGVATAFVPLGALKASVYTSSWRTEQKIVVSSGKQNRITLHREQDTATKVAGKIVLPPSSSVNLKKLSLSVQAIDGQLSEEFTPAVNASGQFSFAANASVIGCFAYTQDGQWAGATLMNDLSKPLNVVLHPTTYLSGQLLDGAGNPIANHGVHAEPRLENPLPRLGSTGFSTSMKGKPVTTKTDTHGNYRIGPLPRQIEIGMWCDATRPAEQNDREYLGNYFIELDEQRPPKVHRLGPEPSSPSKQTVEERVAELLRDARLGGFHAMFILADTTNERCNSFVQENLLNYDANIQVSSYMQMRFNTGASATEGGKAFVKAKNWPLPTDGNVVAIALDASGKELGQITIDISEGDANDQAARFVEKHSPPVFDAWQKWNEAFALAKKTNRRVWVRISQRYCGPCFRLNNWLDDHRTMLEKEFVLLKIDDVRDKNGVEVARVITGDKPYGVPFFAFYDADQNMLIDSSGPTGNIGSISGYEGKRHFRKMLQKVKQTLSDEEIERIVGSVED